MLDKNAICQRFASAKCAFTRVPQVDQHGLINQSERCEQFLSTGLTGEQVGPG